MAFSITEVIFSDKRESYEREAADLQFLVEVVLFGGEVVGHGGTPVIFSAVTFKHAGDCSHGPVGSLGRIIAISWRVRLST